MTDKFPTAQQLLDETNERVATPEDIAAAQPDYETAFLVVVSKDGTCTATTDLKPITINRSAGLGDMRRACQEIVHDINASNTVNMMMQSFAAQAQYQAEQQDAQRIAAKIQERGILLGRG